MRPVALTAVAALACACVPLWAGSARAQEGFSQRGKVVVALDNLGGFVHNDTTQNNVTSSTNSFGFFPFSPVGRIGVHGFVAGGLSLGGSLMYSDSNQSYFFLPAGTTLGIVPRVGYAIPFNATLAIWARGGITYWDTGRSGGGSVWQLAPGGELYLVITPVSHFGITLGPWGEFAVAGKISQQSPCVGGAAGCGPNPSQDLRLNLYGVTFGVLADF
jgi:hypothetical protein